MNEAVIDRESKLPLGFDGRAGCHVLSIPVSNRMADYEEAYRLSVAEYEGLITDVAAARAFAEACRARRHGDRLLLQPGSDRGTPS